MNLNHFKHSIVHSSQREKPLGREGVYLTLKRLLDLAVCFLILPVLLPVMAVIALLIVLETADSPLFIQERVGKGGRRFPLYKFRTLKTSRLPAEKERYMKSYITGEVMIPVTGDSFKPPQQPATRIGALLRKTSLDELPQIFNVICGHMSLVGPRPNVPWEVEEYLDWHRERLDALPGITGLAQINGRSTLTFDELVRYDITYVRQANLRLDISILWKTIPVLLSRAGAG
jgi:lipopolysaccharide/colanic/teichoic acid biosynthesis glycosyltransferase